MASAAHNGAQTGLGASLSRFRSARFAAQGRGIAQLLPVGLYGWLRALLVLALIIQVARLVWTIVTPIAPLGDWQARTANVMSAPSRAALFASFDGFDRAVVTGDASAAVTSLDLTLYGLRMNEASGGGSAIIAGSDGVQSSYSVGEEVAPGVTLVEVQFDHVVLERGGLRESLFIDQSVPGETLGYTAMVPAAGVATVARGSGRAAHCGGDQRRHRLCAAHRKRPSDRLCGHPGAMAQCSPRPVSGPAISSWKSTAARSVPPRMARRWQGSFAPEPGCRCLSSAAPRPFPSR